MIAAQIRAAFRSMRQHRGFTAVAVLSLALGIGANLAVFSVLQRLVLTKLPVRDPDQLHQLVVVQTNGPHYTNPFPKFVVMRDNFTVFKPLFGWGGFKRPVTAGSFAEDAMVAAVTGNYFETLGIRPALGRLITSDDERMHASDGVVISHRVWQTGFGGDTEVLGRTLTVNDQTFTVVGVAPSAFTGTEPGNPPAVYLPLYAYTRLAPQALQAPGNLWFHIMGRLSGDVPVAAVQKMIRDQWAQLDEPNRQRFQRNTRDYILLEDGSHGFSDAATDYSAAVIVLMALVGTVFLIACANLATLLFVRGTGRVRDMSIRFALGASRQRLIGEWMTECLLISTLGGAAGLLAARWFTVLLLYFVAESDRQWLQFQMTPAIVLASVALTLTAGVLCGLLPALRATGESPEATLRAQSGSVTHKRGGLAQAVLAGQLAASLVLVAGAVLFARTLANLNGDSGGFDRHNVVYAIPNFAAARIPRERQAPVMAEVVGRLKASPIIGAVSMGSPPMVWGNGGFGYVTNVTGHALSPDEDNTAYANSADEGFFETLRIPMVAGRGFDQRDRPAPNKPATAVIINERMARHYFGTRNPVGEKIVLSTPFEVVGVVKDVKNTSLRDPMKDVTYRPISTDGWGAVMARARPGVTTTAVEAEIRAAFGAVAKQVPLELAPLEDAVQKTIGRDRLVAQLSAVFGMLGILLASMGLYAAIAHTVNSRTREIGIRMAIGGSTRDVMGMVLKESVRVTAIGVVIGVPVAIAGSHLIGSLLFEVAPADPAALVASTILLGITALLAAWIPSRRAARINPSRTLKYE